MVKDMEKILAIIPSRYASTRFPGKPLALVHGVPMVVRTYSQAAKVFANVCVATDDERILKAVEENGGQAVMTSSSHRSGTDRCLEALQKYSEKSGKTFCGVVNVQGDEPEILGDSVDTVAALLRDHPEAVMATLCTPIRTLEKAHDPSCVKVVFDELGRALYFSRSLIPFPRDGVTEADLRNDPPIFYQHLGIYAYRRDFLLKISTLPRTKLEKLESLEQLRVLENGYEIMVGVVPRASIGIDTPADYAEFVKKWLGK